MVSMETQSVTGTYVLDGEKLSLIAEGDSLTGTLKNGKITITEGSDTLIFELKEGTGGEDEPEPEPDTGSQEDMEGTYVIFEMDGQDIEEALKQLNETGEEMTAEELYSITFYQGGEFSIFAAGQDYGTGTYRWQGGKLVLSMEGDELAVELKDGIITMKNDSQTVKLKKK